MLGYYLIHQNKFWYEVLISMIATVLFSACLVILWCINSILFGSVKCNGWDILLCMNVRWILFELLNTVITSIPFAHMLGYYLMNQSIFCFSSDTCNYCKSNLIIHAHVNTLVITINIKLCQNINRQTFF